MLESESLSKEQQDYFYSFVDAFHKISTDLRNVDLLMHKGRFFDAIDVIRTSQQTALIMEKKVKDCVKELNDTGKW